MASRTGLEHVGIKLSERDVGFGLVTNAER